MNICYSSKQLLEGILFKEGMITGSFGEDCYYVQCHLILSSNY